MELCFVCFVETRETFYLNRAGMHSYSGKFVTPAFPSQNDTITVVFDATEGNGALTGVSPVYAHAGLITNQSTSPTDWKHVQGNWGTADPNVLMTSLGNNLHQLQYHIPTYYGF